MDWLPLTLLCAFSLASADAATKRFLADYPAPAIVVVRFFGPFLVLLPLLGGHPWPAMPLAFWGWLAVLVPIEVLALLLYMRAISTSPLSKTLPYLALTPVFTAVTGYGLLGESLSLMSLMGILLVTVGAYVISLPRVLGHGWQRLFSPLKALREERGAALMVAVAALYSVTSVIGKQMLHYVPALFFGPFYNGVLGVTVVLFFGFTQPSAFPVLWRRPAAVLLVALAAAAEVLTHYLALETVEVAYLSAVKRTSLLMGILYGAWLFKEPRLFQNLTAGMIMVAGVVFIVFGQQ